MSAFVRFPHTPHLVWLGEGEPRDDKLMGEEEVRDFLCDEIIVEEKVDGANLGFSIDFDGSLRAQNRGHWLDPPFDGQFTRLGSWFSRHNDALFDALGTELILFGEWCAARHSLYYQRLPDYFLAFDVYDSVAKRFWSVARRNAFAAQLDIAVVPRILQGKYSLHAVKRELESARSIFRDGPVEGFYLRKESGDWLWARAKIVNADFTQTIGEHWSRRRMQWNAMEGPRATE
ncbi:MAG: RNA ligase family protein [Treponema sp.]|nr:RNA ligase family protein [Treponema sp.]